MNNDFINQRSSTVRRLFLAAAGVASAATTLQAHPGHSLLDEGAQHALTSPFHLAVLALLGVALFAGAHLTQKVMPRRALQSLGVIAVALSAVLWGLHL